MRVRPPTAKLRSVCIAAILVVALRGRVLQQIAAVLAQVIRQEQRLPGLHLTEHLDRVAYVFDFKREVVWSLTLRAPVLEYA